MVRDREREKRVGSYRGESGLGQRCWTSEDAVAAGASWLFPYLLGLLVLKFLRIDVYPTSVCVDTVVAFPHAHFSNNGSNCAAGQASANCQGPKALRWRSVTGPKAAECSQFYRPMAEGKQSLPLSSLDDSWMT